MTRRPHADHCGLAELTHGAFVHASVALMRSSCGCVGRSPPRRGGQQRFARPKFFQAATQADFLKGDVENLSIDSRGQLLLGPATELVYETAVAIPLGDRARQPTGRCSSAPATKAACSGSMRKGKGTLVLRRRRARGARARAGAGRRPVRRHLARREDLQGRSQRDGDDVLRTRREIHLGAGHGRQRVTCTPPPARRASSTASRPTERARGSIRPRRRTSRRWPSIVPATCSIGTESPGRVLRVDPEGKGFVLLDSPFQEIRALRFDDKGMLFAAAVSGARRRRSAPPPRTDDRPAERPSEPSSTPVATVTTEVTSIAVVDVSGGGISRDDVTRGPRAPRAARCTASRPTACGISCGSRATIRRTTSRSTAKAG